jgi:hypothetical protein
LRLNRRKPAERIIGLAPSSPRPRSRLFQASSSKSCRAIFNAVADGWSPLRWGLFVDPLHNYIGRTFTAEAVLATELGF